MITNSSAQDYTQQNLPEGAKARIEIRKGDINYGLCNDIQFSLDSNQLAVASSTKEILNDIPLELTVNNEIRIYTVGGP